MSKYTKVIEQYKGSMGWQQFADALSEYAPVALMTSYWWDKRGVEPRDITLRVLSQAHGWVGEFGREMIAAKEGTNEIQTN